VLGTVLGALVAAVRERTWTPVGSAIVGIRSIFTDYAGSTFLAPRSQGETQHVGRAVPAPP
jgi:hypothetical protein